MIKIGLLDPSLMDNNGNVSSNLGDVIIFDAVINALNDIFEEYILIRVSTHINPSRENLRKLSKCDYIFIGGTNLLSSNIQEYNQWEFELKKIISFLFPLKNITLLGVGWWQYQDLPTEFTKARYKNILKSKFIHSVRDSYTKNMLVQCGVSNVLNTTCPTLWGLNDIDLNRSNLQINKCVFTLTDYNKSLELDESLIEMILNYFTEDIYFFAQGLFDKEYLSSLPIYKKNINRIHILEQLNVYNELLRDDVVYIGTRLHGGARAIQMNKESIVLQVDNRTTEISNDTNFPSVKRTDLLTVSKWIEGDNIFSPMKIDLNSVNIWKKQFCESV